MRRRHRVHKDRQVFENRIRLAKRISKAKHGARMERTLLKSKIHRATVTDADLDYEGSVTIDSTLMHAANLVPYEQVDIYDITNGSRLTTYVIEGAADSGAICINGAAAHHVKPGDLVIIVAYARVHESTLDEFTPRIILVNEQNQQVPGQAVESA